MKNLKSGAFFFLSLVVSTGCNSSSGGASAEGTVPLPPVSSVQVASTFPAGGAVQVPLDSVVSVQFSGLVDPATVQPYSFALYVGLGGVNQVAGSVTSDGQKAIFLPSQPLKSLTAYRAVVTAEIKDEAGKPLAGEFSWTFWTKDIVPPSVVTTFPLSQQKFLALDATLQATFSEPMVESSINESSFFLKDKLGAAVPGTVSVQNGVAYFDPQQPFAEDEEYTATLTDAIVDGQGNALSSYTWSFRTTEFTAPSIVSVYPLPDAVDVPFDGTVIQVTFSEPIDPVTVSSATLQLSSAKGPVPGTISVNGSVLSFDPTPIFDSETEYTAQLFPGCKDLAGNQFLSSYTWKFISEIKVLGNPGPVAETDSGATPIVSINESGDTAMILTKVSGGLKDVFGLTFSSVTGWSSPVPLEGHANNAQGLGLALDGAANAFAVWTQLKGGGKFQGRSNSFVAGGGPPPESILLGVESTVDPTPKIGADSAGKAIAIWKEKVSGAKANLLWSSTSAPILWTTPALLESDDTGDVKSLDLYMAPDGKACAAWGQDVGGKQNIYASRFDGTSWTSPPDLLEFNDDDIAKGPLVRGDGKGNYFVIWLQKTDADGNGTINNKDKFSLYATRFLTNGSGGSWDLTPSLLESDDNQDVGAYSLAVDSLGNAHAAWVQTVLSDPSSQNVFSAHFDVNIGSWSAPILVEDKPEAADSPQIMCPAPNQATIVFVQTENLFYQTLFTANLVLPAVAWTEAVPLEAEPTGLATDPSVATDGKGAKLSAWSMGNKIWANFFP